MAKKRARTERRERLRALQKLAGAKEKLAAIEPGGSPERPIEVPASPVVDIRAASMRCLQCDGEVHVEDHTAEKFEGRSLRVAHIVCQRCGTARRVYFRLAPPLAN